MFKKPEVTFPKLMPTAIKPTKNVILFGEVLFDAFPDRLVLGGAPFNVACHLRAFGFNPTLITRTGSDEYRDILLAAMHRFDMETMGVQCDPSRPTGRVQVHIDHNGHQFEILPDQAYDYIHPAITRMVALSAQADMVYFGTLAQRSKTSRRALNALLECTSAPRMLDINLRSPWYDPYTLRRSLTQADVVKVNVEELEALASMLRLPGNGDHTTAAALVKLYELVCLLVTYGEHGAWVLNKDGTEVHTEGQVLDTPMADTVGAGDAFSAVFIVGALSGWPLAQTLVRANAFASAVCGIRGAVPDNHKFYEPFLNDWQSGDLMKIESARNSR